MSHRVLAYKKWSWILLGVLIFALIVIAAEATLRGPEKQLGTLKIELSYPSDYVPAMIVCADPIEWWKLKRCMTTEADTRKIKLSVPKGQYYVFASTLDAWGRLWISYRAYYSEFIKCGLNTNCKDHSPIQISVESGQTIGEISPSDWYLD